jgi:hypothetical protein
MAYVKVQGDQIFYPYNIGQLLRDNPNMSFPKLISDERLATFDVHPVITLSAPAYNAVTHKVVQDTIPTEADGVWELRWAVTALSVDELSEIATKNGTDARAERDRLLAASDWTQLPDVNVDKDAWTTYRQLLRDITEQPEFPNVVIWPAKPGETLE